MNKPIVGVNTPASGSVVGLGVDAIVAAGEAVSVAMAVAVAVAVAVGLVVGVVVGVDVWVGVADGVDSKAGPSAAETTKVLVMAFVIPLVSVHFIVTVCLPGSRPAGGLHDQLPEDPAVIDAV